LLLGLINDWLLFFFFFCCAQVDGAVVCKNVELINPSVGGTPKVMPPHSMVFGNGPEDLGDILDRATSFSCSLGAAMGRVIGPMLEGRPVQEDLANQPLLFCCENDHDAVAKLKAQLAGKVDRSYAFLTSQARVGL
jgi:hypothetical protein